MPSYLNHHVFDPVNPPATFFDVVTHDLLVMLGMLVGHAGDVECTISRENAVKYDIVLARTKNGREKNEIQRSKNKSAPKIVCPPLPHMVEINQT